MRAGAFLSAVGHAAVITLAVWGLPWLRARPEPPVPVVNVSFVSAADFAAAVAALSRGSPVPAAPAPSPAPLPAKRVEPPPPEPSSLPPDTPPEPDEAPVADLAPAFDPAAPLGIARSAVPPVAIDPPAVEAPRILDRAAPPRPRPPAEARASAGAAGTDAVTSAVGAGASGEGRRRAGFEAAVRAAIARAQIYPGRARAAGITGTPRLHIVVARDGRLMEARIARSSGSLILDAASLAAARTAHLPAAPVDLPDPSFSFEIGLAFTLTGD